MTYPDRDPHLRPGHPYPRLPAGIRICDDEAAAGDYFFYRDLQLIVHAEDLRRVRDLLADAGVRPDRYELTESPAGRPLILLEFRADSGIDTIDLFRRIRFDRPHDDHDGADHGDDQDHGTAGPGELEPGTPRVWPNHVAGLQYHTNWGAGDLPHRHTPLSDLPVGDNLPGNQVRVGVLDSGIANQLWFGNRWLPAAGRSPAEVTEDLDDVPVLPYQSGHGTFCAGIVLQHAPGAQLVIDRLGHTAGLIDDWELHQRLAALLEPVNELDVVNLSLGCFTAYNLPLPGTCDVITAAVAANPELVVVASAGNDGQDRPMFPAALREVIGVGAVTSVLDLWPLTNFGEWVDAWSLGEELPSTFLQWPATPTATGELDPGPRPATASDLQDKRFDGWASWSGTSFAAARVSGAIAAELKQDGRSPRRVVFDLVTNAPVRIRNGGLVTPATYVV